MAQFKKLSLAVAAATLLGANAAHAVDIQAGDWKLSVGGNVNAFAISNSCDKSAPTVTLGLACQGNDSINIGNGLLPNEISFTASTRQDDLDISAVISLWPTIDTSAAGQTGGANINSRQGFLTFGDKSWGTIKLGRDLGIFGSDAILSDMTLLSAGNGNVSNNGTGYGPPTAPTTLGRIGSGYIYADWIPQISYSSPNFNGFAVTAGVMQGLAGGSSGYSNKQPGFQGKLTFDTAAAGVNAHLWGGFLTQKNEAGVTAGGATIKSYDANAYEVGAKIGAGDFEGVAYYYDGDGVGTTLIGLASDDGLGNKRKSKGGYLQGTYKIGKVKLGLSYGESKLDLASGELLTDPSGFGTALKGDLVKKNTASIASAYYSLTKSVTLVGEYINSESERQAGTQKAKSDTFVLGGILFF